MPVLFIERHWICLVCTQRNFDATVNYKSNTVKEEFHDYRNGQHITHGASVSELELASLRCEVSVAALCSPSWWGLPCSATCVASSPSSWQWPRSIQVPSWAPLGILHTHTCYPPMLAVLGKCHCHSHKCGAHSHTCSLLYRTTDAWPR